MPANPLGKLLKPRFPPCAVGIDAGGAAVVQLDRGRGGFTVKRAASINLPTGLVRSSFDENNIDDPGELARALSDLLAAAGLLHQRKWSVTLPETSTRAAVIALEGVPGSRRELEELLEWKIERSFGAPLSELRVSRDQLAADSQKQSRYLITAIRRSVLAEYEAIFAGLGWQAGLILPRHAGEQQWLRNGQQGDGLLLTAHAEGFTAVLVRNNRPIILRAVFCQVRIGANAFPVVQVEQHGRAFGRGCQQVFEFAQRMRADHITLVGGEHIAVRAFADEYVEVVKPEVRHYFVELALAVDVTQQLGFG